MIKLLKLFKSSLWAVALIVALLIVQAYADLALPGYTADIVNNGISQGGITESIPKEMSPETLEALAPFMNEGEADFVLSQYAVNEAGNLALQAKDSETLDTLASMMQTPMIIVNMFSGSTVADPERIQQLKESNLLTDEQLESLRQLMQPVDAGQIDPEQISRMLESGMVTQEQLAQLAGMTPEQRLAFGETIKAKAIRALADQLFSGEASELMREQMARAFIRAEYTAIGLNMEKIQTNYLLTTGGKMLAMTLLMVAAAVAVGFLASRTAARIARDVRSKIFRKVVSFSGGDIDKFSTASLITRSTNDVQQLQMATVMILRMALYAPILGIGGVIRVAGTRTGLGWIVFAAVMLLIVIVALLLVVAMPKFNRMQSLIDRINLVAREILTGLPVIRAFSRERYESERFEVANKNLMKTQLFTNRVMTLMMPIMMLIMNGISLMIYWFGGKGIDSGALLVGDMMAFTTYTMQIVMSFLMLTMLSVMLPRAIVSAGRIDEVLRTEPSIRDGQEALDGDDREWKGTVSFEDVSFHYPDAEANMLEHISFTAEPGKTTAIIGSTGSGKSTVLNLIPRFFEVSEGRVAIDGVDIRDMTQKKLRSLLGYVPQKGVLFSGDIESNIKFGGEFITDADMIQAAEISQATEFIAERKDGYHDPIAQGGTNVSGGQKQRLSIARALAKKPKVLLFDDSFSALDYRTDVTLRRELNEKVHDATIIVVAQRISTVLHADQIVVIEEGRVVGIGTHADLMKTCAQYQEIAKSQLSDAELMGGYGV